MSTEDKDSLRSTSFARIIDLVSEGEIVGLVDGARSIYLDDTPLQNADGSYNFSGVKWDQRTGTPTQSEFAGFPSVERTVGVNVRVKYGQPIVRTITDSTVDAVNVVVSVPALLKTSKDTGDIAGANVSLVIEVQPNGGAWQAFGSSTTPLAMQIVSAAAVTMPDGTVATRCDLTVNMTDVEQVNYLIEYRTAGSTGAWSTFGSGTVNTLPGRYDKNGSQIFAGSATVSRADLVQGRYEFRLTNTSGTGTLTLLGTYYSIQSIVQIRGKSSSKYQRQIQCRLPAGGAPWNVRVTRISDDSTTQYIQNDTYWDSYTEVTEDKLRLPFSAAVAMTIDAQNFGSNIPSRAFDLKLLKVKIPSNYNPLTRVYTGSWDGTFTTAWTDNPAWVFYDLLTHPRYGLGAFVGTGVDKWALYQIGKYCDELVPNGFGGTEPRFTCNVYLATKQDAYKLVNDLASVFRGLVYWATGSITAVQDAPSDPVAQFTPANVIDNEFNYQGSSAKARHTAVLVTWNDPADLYRQKVEYVEDAAGIARYGLIITEVAALGCTSRGQAARVGRWLLYSELNQTETVGFKVALEGVRCRPGQVIKIIDPVRAGVRLGGRLLAATTSTFTLDAPVTLAAGQTYTLTTMKADGTLQDATVTTAAGTTSTITVSPAFSQAPTVGSIWVLASNAVQPQLFQVLTVTETARAEFEIVGVAYNSSKFAAVETGLALQSRSISVLTDKPAAPTNIAVTEALYAAGSVLASRLDVSWTAPAGASGYAVTWTRDDGTSSGDVLTAFPGIDIDGAKDGQVYTVTVYALNALNIRSAAPATITYTVAGKSAAPSNVQGFVVARASDVLNFSWRPIADLDAARYEIRRGEAWENSIVVASAPHPTNYASVSAPRGGRFLIKAVDTSGNYSDQAAYIDAADLSGINVVLTYEDGAGGFNGQFDGTYEYVTSSSPSWGATTTWDSAGTWDAFSVRRGVALNVGATSGTYISEVVDIGYMASSLVSVDANVESLGPLSLPWSTYTQPWSYYSGSAWTWRAKGGAIGSAYEISTSADGVTWSDWSTFTSGAYLFRYMRLRVTLSTSDANYRPYMTRLTINVDVPDRVEHFADVAVPVAGATIAFAPAFVGVATVQCTLQSASVGDTVKVTAKSASSVTVQVFNSAGTAKAAVVDVDVYGYGERFT